MAQIGAVFVFCSSCKILYFASSVHPKNATAVYYVECIPQNQCVGLLYY